MRFFTLAFSLVTGRLATHRQRIQAVRCLAVSLFAAVFLSSGVYEPSASLVLLGDIMLGRGVAEAHPEGDWESVLQSLQPFTRSADLALANLESPIGCTATVASNPRLLVAPPEAVSALDSAGLDILSMVNNHAMDAGPDGKRCTVESLAALGIATLDSPYTTIEISVRGLDFAFLAIDFTREQPPGLVDDLARRIRLASEAGKIVVVSIHWGLEYQSGHDALQERIAVRLANSSADILWGHHPHVAQQIEWKNGTLVLYSLGNAVFDQWQPEAVRQGTLVWVDVDRRGVFRIGILPFSIDPDRGKTGTVDLLSLRIFPSSSIPHGI